MSTPEAREAARRADNVMRARHAIRAETAPVRAPLPRVKPARRQCLGCGMNRNAFATKTEFDTHEQLCLFGGLGPGDSI